MLYPARWKKITIDESKVLKNRLFRVFGATRYIQRRIFVLYPSRLDIKTKLYIPSTENNIASRQDECFCTKLAGLGVYHACYKHNLKLNNSDLSDLSLASFYQIMAAIKSQWKGRPRQVKIWTDRSMRSRKGYHPVADHFSHCQFNQVTLCRLFVFSFRFPFFFSSFL